MYLTVKDAAKKWGLNERRVRQLCQENRIEGLVKKGKAYLIPESAAKPLDLRGKQTMNKTKISSKINFETYLKEFPDRNGYFGPYGGSFVPEKLQRNMNEVYNGYLTICKSARFINELRHIRQHFQGRPTPVYHCERLSNYLGKVQIYLKREDLNHMGSHKLNHCMGEALLAKYLGKTKLIAETGAGSHGSAVATAAAYFGMECDIYMGEVDMQKQASNVSKMRLLSARVIPVKKGTRTLKEAVDAALEAYANEYKTTFYCMGSVVGPHPYPMIVREFQQIIGREAREQFLEMTGELPDVVCACVGGGSNSIGMFGAFLNDPVQIVGVEPMGKGPEKGQNAATMTFGKDAVIHGFKTKVLQDEKGNILDAYSIASGLDYPGVGPEHAFLRDIGRVQYETVTDEETVEAFRLLSRLEGIIPALESAHALAYAIKIARSRHSGSVLVNLSGRGDKDMDYLIEKYPDLIE